jgi:hypothetical protein
VYAPDDSSSALSMDELWSNHAQNYSNFVYADGFGYIEGRQQVAGFISHGFGKLDFRVNGGTAKLRDDWQLSRLYLVSLLKFETPRVYVSKSLPRMEELKDAATRSLDEFEEEALRRLRNGEDLVVQSRPHRTRLLGSLRAIKQCLDCHNVRRGHLLGAFSYELRRTHSKPANDKRVDRPRT